MRKKHLFFLVLFMQALFFRSHAAKITVTNSSDNLVGGLRFAIANAAAGDTIGFAPSLVGGIISISPTVILINKNLTIIGPGSDKLMLTNHRTNALVFIVEDGVNVFMSGIQIEGSGDDEVPMQNGLSGAIYNKGNLTIEDAVFYSNYIGAIYSTGVLNLNRVTFYGNYTKGNNYPGRCSGITSSGVSTIKNCLFDSNGSDGGGGNTGSIQNSGTMVVENTSVIKGWSQLNTYNIAAAIMNTGTLQLINSTVSKCYTMGKGYPGAGGIYNAGNLSLEYCTIAYNTMDNTNYPAVPFHHPDYFHHFKGSGIYNTGTLSLRGSIIAQNGDEDFYSPYRGSLPIEEGADGYSTTVVNDLGYNLVGVNNGLNLKATTNILGTNLKHIDPRLGPLQNNSDGRWMHALTEGSLCIDAGRSPAAVLLDQRGVTRDKPDIGAYEYKGGSVTFFTGYSYFEEQSTVTLVNIFSQDSPHLLVSHVPGYKKLKLGYDGYGLYHANKNVVSGGNTTLEITLKNFYSGTDWDKIQIRPNGSTVNPLSLKNYVDNGIDIDHLLGIPRTIKIPLSDFDPSIDFTQLIILEFPYSNNAGYFKLGIEKIIFTGGITPFLWFGATKVDNTFDGGGVGGQLIASKFNATLSDLISKVEFFNGTEKIAETTIYPFSHILENVESGLYTITAVAHITGGIVVLGTPVSFIIPPRIQRESSLLESDLNEESVYPNPTVDIITIKSLHSNAKVTIRDINGSIQYQEPYSNLQNGQADISYLPAGLYFLKLEDEENSSGKVFKLIKQ
ncbi:FG-GAP repeat-containing protein [Sporocytophaga myxococcoides]|uniref:FG-GAP repeat-containing protein n=1 Tax=Sporocytophaga myxococcoides TaxID=153721 RepID=A0A098LKV8_9BACT|nr:choice-of-anchor Q domain-containing protein [Sporocytophaga myxococcoides]GAL87631.1 FG-GAP repeat-containing protein [Sporocytophaga myxococcoides]